MTKHEDNLRTVGQVATLLGLSVRTLHHWEERGLVTPSVRTGSNYRLYSESDIARCQQVMIYRATGMGLASVARLLNCEADALVHLRRQRDLLMERETELHQMVQAVDKLLEDAMSKKNLSVEEIADVLGDASFPAHHAEAEDQWGGTDDWAIYAERSAKMTKADWETSKEDTTRMEHDLVKAMKRGVCPGSAEANQLAETHREWLSQFFPVSHAKQVLISCGYVTDPQFKEHYDSQAEGLAKWLKAIIDANAEANGIDPEGATWE